MPMTITQQSTTEKFSAITQYIKAKVESDFFETPYFKKYMSSVEPKDDVHFYKAYNYIQNCNLVNKIWPNIAFDHFQSYQKILEIFECHKNVNEVCFEWIRDNMSPTTFLNMINMYYSKHGIIKTDTMLNDTFNQLEKLLNKKNNPSTPKRWRLDEFHDHVSHLYLEQTVENKEHNPIFIPEPFIQDNYKVYQPKDTLQLALWGKRVHNCVLSYEEKIIEEESAIILIEKDSCPTYTFELKYKDLKKSIISVSQAVGISNSSIPSDQKNILESIIRSAIKK
jgi:hypothetical protein